MYVTLNNSKDVKEDTDDDLKFSKKRGIKSHIKE